MLKKAFLLLLVVASSLSAMTPLEKINTLDNQQRLYEAEFKIAQRYFNTYLNNNIGRAKSLYLYMTASLTHIQRIQEQLDMAILESNDTEATLPAFNQALDRYIALQKTYRSLETTLKERFLNIQQLKESAVFIDTTHPIIEVIEGRLDSDYDGTPDDVELAGDSVSAVSGH